MFLKYLKKILSSFKNEIKIINKSTVAIYKRYNVFQKSVIWTGISTMDLENKAVEKIKIQECLWQDEMQGCLEGMGTTTNERIQFSKNSTEFPSLGTGLREEKTYLWIVMTPNI